ncbi:MAG: c-type cytochrome biogenesis protein CcmI [Pseudomonadota bacterium]
MIFLILLAIAGFYLMQPFLVAQASGVEALDETRRQRATVDLDEAEGRLTAQAAGEARDALDRRILALLDADKAEPQPSNIKSAALFIVPAVLLLGAFGIYTQIGSPAYTPISFAEYQTQRAAELPDTLEELVVELKARLEADPSPPADGYVLLARSYLRLGAPQAALEAYEVAIQLSGGADAIVEERDEVIRILRQRSAAPPIDPEARAQIESMSPEEQAAMIEGMVEGLAVRLEQDPRDIQGWMRLIRARAVMGDFAQARQDLAAARQTFPVESEEGQMLAQLAEELLPPPPEPPQD